PAIARRVRVVYHDRLALARAQLSNPVGDLLRGQTPHRELPLAGEEYPMGCPDRRHHRCSHHADPGPIQYADRRCAADVALLTGSFAGSVCLIRPGYRMTNHERRAPARSIPRRYDITVDAFDFRRYLNVHFSTGGTLRRDGARLAFLN